MVEEVTRLDEVDVIFIRKIEKGMIKSNQGVKRRGDLL